MGMEFSSLFALPDGLEVAETSMTGQVLTLFLVATAATAICPLCGHASLHLRSSSTRHVADVPYAGRQVQLILRVRKFRFLYPRIFALFAYAGNTTVFSALTFLQWHLGS